MAKKKIDFGTLPREGYVYSLYRGHMIRLAFAVAALAAILIWSLSGTWPTLKSRLFPSGSVDMAALSEVPIPEVTEDPQRTAFYADHIESERFWLQDSCYRLDVSLESVDQVLWSSDAATVYRCTAEGRPILVAADAVPAVGIPSKAVFYAVPAQLIYDLRAYEDLQTLPAYLADLRDVEVAYESSDSVQLIIFAPIVLLAVIYWLLLLQDPRRHPIYRQLGRYGLPVSDIVASIDQEVAAGQLAEQSNKLLATTSWNFKKTAFMTTIFKNTAPADLQKGRNDNE